MKLKHLTIFFVLFAILSYVVFMVGKNYVAIEAEKARVAEIARKARVAERDKVIKARAIEREKANKAYKQTSFDRILKDMTYYSRGLNNNIDIPEAILKLEDLIAQGANPNKKISFSEGGEYVYLYTPISYIFLTCGNDDYIDDADGRNFYLEIVKLLIDSGVDWNDKDSYEVYESEYEDNSGTSTIADTLIWVEENSTKPECLEVLAYVQNHLKENNIVIEE